MSRLLGAALKPRMEVWSTASGRSKRGHERRFRSSAWQHVAKRQDVAGGVSSCVDRDRRVCLRAGTMVDHFLDELLASACGSGQCCQGNHGQGRLPQQQPLTVTPVDHWLKHVETATISVFLLPPVPCRPSLGSRVWCSRRTA